MGASYDAQGVRWTNNAIAENSVAPLDQEAQQAERIGGSPEGGVAVGSPKSLPESRSASLEHGEVLGLDSVMNMHLHETCDSPPFSFQTFSLQLYLHEFSPFSIPFLFVFEGRKGLTRGQIQGAAPIEVCPHSPDTGGSVS